MIKIEVVKFQAQDVITASSVPATPLQPAHRHDWKWNNKKKEFECKCGATTKKLF